MATASSKPRTIIPQPREGEVRYLLRGVGWDGYEALLEWFGDDNPRMNYANGDIEFMSSLAIHGKYDDLLRFMVEAIAEELALPFESFSPITLRKRMAECGLEPDGSFYFANVGRLAGGREIDLDVEPPPDLCTEIEITNSLLPKLDIYGGIGVPEIWRFDGKTLTVLILGPDRIYTPSDRSASLPFVPMPEIQRFLLEYAIGQQLPWRRAFRAWVREVVAPLRDRGQAGAG